jgi:hypothetical protein
MEFTLTLGQYALIMNDPVHYDISMRFNSKTNKYEGEANPQQMRKIKALVDEPK